MLRFVKKGRLREGLIGLEQKFKENVVRNVLYLLKKPVVSLL